MAKLTTEELLQQFADLTLVELSEFVKAFNFNSIALLASAVAARAAGGMTTTSAPLLWDSCISLLLWWLNYGLAARKRRLASATIMIGALPLPCAARSAATTSYMALNASSSRSSFASRTS